jgi:hypothetical protein
MRERGLVGMTVAPRLLIKAARSGLIQSGM